MTEETYVGVEAARPFAMHAIDYKNKGWHPFILPIREKHPPPAGYTGTKAGDNVASMEEIETWVRTAPQANIGIRPIDMIGIDVDAYEEKHGDRTLAEWEAEAGALPVTYRVGSRFHEDKVSGIRLFRLPPGVSTEGWTGGYGGIELIRKEHRYFVAPGSIHPKVGRAYECLHEETGTRAETLPGVHMIPYLPDRWVDYLSHLKAPRLLRAVGEGETASRNRIAEEKLCAAMSDRLSEAIILLSSAESRHDTMNTELLALCRLAEQGHKGIAVALRTLRDSFVVAVLDRSSVEDATAEFKRGLVGARDLVEKTPSADEYKGCFCNYLSVSSALAGATETAAEIVVASEDKSATYNYIPFTDEKWWSPPQAQFAIPHLLVEGRTGVIYSPGGQGKSLLSLDIALGISVTGDVFGIKVEKAHVLYIDRENPDDDIRDRLKAMGVGPGEDWSRFHYSLLGDWPPLDTEAGGAALVAEMKRTGSTVLVIDTMSKVVRGEENGSDTWSNLHRLSMVALKREGFSVIQLDHSGKDEDRGIRGSSAKHDNADVVWYLKAYDKTGDVKLTRKKNRSGRHPEEVVLQRMTTPHLKHVLLNGSLIAAASGLTPAEGDEIAALAEKHMNFEDKVDQVVALLDFIKAPDTMPRVELRAFIKETGHTAPGNTVLGQAMERRRKRSESKSSV